MIKEYQRITNVDPAPTRRNSFDFIFGSEDTSDYDSIIVCGIVNSRLFPVSLLLKERKKLSLGIKPLDFLKPKSSISINIHVLHVLHCC